MTIIAPRIQRFADLGHEWRHVATSNSAARTYHGDLADHRIRLRYIKMRDAGTITCVGQRADGGIWHVFARIPPDKSPAVVHRNAIQAQHKAIENSRIRVESRKEFRNGK